jgi:hypothetical protein
VKIVAFTCVALVVTGRYAHAADIPFFCANNLQQGMLELIGPSQKESGHNVSKLRQSKGFDAD